jgi:hypothetical protein
MAVSLMAELADMYADEITYEPRTGQDGHGTPTFGSAVTIKCHLRGEHKLVKNSAGQEELSTVQAWLDGVYGVSIQGRFTLPARYSPQQPPAIAVDPHTDENGPHHEKVMF